MRMRDHGFLKSIKIKGDAGIDVQLPPNLQSNCPIKSTDSQDSTTSDDKKGEVELFVQALVPTAREIS